LSCKGEIVVFWVLAFDAAPSQRRSHITLGRNKSLWLLFSFEIGDGLELRCSCRDFLSFEFCWQWLKIVGVRHMRVL
jgi:hypothetical protein